MRQVKVVTRISINTSPKDVFCYLENLRYHYLWNPQTRDIKPIIKLKQGSKYTTINSVLGVKITAKNHVTKFLENKELEIVNDTGLVHYCVNFELLPVEGKTQVVCSVVASADSRAFAFTKPVLKALAQRELQTDLQALKVAVEHGIE